MAETLTFFQEMITIPLTEVKVRSPRCLVHNFREHRVQVSPSVNPRLLPRQLKYQYLSFTLEDILL